MMDRKTYKATLCTLLVIVTGLFAGCISSDGETGRSASPPFGGLTDEALLLEQAAILTSFTYHREEADAGIALDYTLIHEEDQYYLEIFDGFKSLYILEKTEAPEMLAQELSALLVRQQITLWGDYESWPEAPLDGACFSLLMEFADGGAFEAHGYERLPEGYHLVNAALTDFFDAALETYYSPTLDSADYFQYSFGSYHEGEWYYTITKNENGFILNALGYNGVDLDIRGQMILEDEFNNLLRIVREYNLESWNGFAESDQDLLDGYGFNLKVGQNGGTRLVISASGYMAVPEGYEEAHAALSEYLLSMAEEHRQSEMQ